MDRAFIGRLVGTFHDRVRNDPRLGPIFAREIAGDWEQQCEKMTEFWCSVIPRTGTYDGRLVLGHARLMTALPLTAVNGTQLRSFRHRNDCSNGSAVIVWLRN